MVVSANKQTTYGTVVLVANMNQPVRMDGAAFPAIIAEVYSDLDRWGKGHQWPMVRKRILQDTGFQMGLELTDFLAGWMFAFIMGADTITGVGPYTHAFTWLQSTNQAPVTTVYFRDTTPIAFQMPDLAITDLEISGADRGPLMGKFSMKGSGRYVDGGIAEPAVPQTPVYLLGSDTDILLGPQGAAVSIKERVRGWSVKLQSDIRPHRAPGGTLYSTFHKILTQRATVSLNVAAKDTDDIRTLIVNDTLQELQINTNSGAAAILNLKFPGLYFSEPAQLGVDGVEEIWGLQADERAVIKSGANEIFTATVINNQATYLVAG